MTLSTHTIRKVRAAVLLSFDCALRGRFEGEAPKYLERRDLDFPRKKK
jgi:hypothetical protein